MVERWSRSTILIRRLFFAFNFQLLQGDVLQRVELGVQLVNVLAGKEVLVRQRFDLIVSQILLLSVVNLVTRVWSGLESVTGSFLASRGT